MSKQIVRSSTVFYESFVASTRDLPGDDFKEAWLAVFDYAFYDEEPGEMDPLKTMFFKMAKPNLDRNIQNRENGLNGGRPKKPSVSDEKPKSKSVSDKKPRVTKQKTEHIYDVDEDVDVDVAVDEDGDVVVDVSASSVEIDTTTDSAPTEFGTIPTTVEIIKAFDAEEYELADGELNRFIKYNREHKWKMGLQEAVKQWIANDKKGKKIKFNFDQRDDYDLNAIEMAHLQKQMDLPPMEGRDA